MLRRLFGGGKKKSTSKSPTRRSSVSSEDPPPITIAQANAREEPERLPRVSISSSSATSRHRHTHRPKSARRQSRSPSQERVRGVRYPLSMNEQIEARLGQSGRDAPPAPTKTSPRRLEPMSLRDALRNSVSRPNDDNRGGFLGEIQNVGKLRKTTTTDTTSSVDSDLFAADFDKSHGLGDTNAIKEKKVRIDRKDPENVDTTESEHLLNKCLSLYRKCKRLQMRATQNRSCHKDIAQLLQKLQEVGNAACVSNLSSWDRFEANRKNWCDAVKALATAYAYLYECVNSLGSNFKANVSVSQLAEATLRFLEEDLCNVLTSKSVESQYRESLRVAVCDSLEFLHGTFEGGPTAMKTLCNQNRIFERLIRMAKDAEVHNERTAACMCLEHIYAPSNPRWSELLFEVPLAAA